MRRFVRNHPFVSYYLLALTLCSLATVWTVLYGIAWQAHSGTHFSFNETIWADLKEFGHGRLYANIISIAWAAANRHSVFFSVFLFAGAPTISAITISLIGWGPSGLGRLFARLKPWSSGAFRSDAIQVYVLMTLFFFAVSLGHLGLLAWGKGPDAAMAAARLWGLPALLFPIPFLIGGLIDEGGTCEELGWRGFALPVLLGRISSPLLASVVLGVLWWLWHFPREAPDIAAGDVKWGAFLTGQLIFVLLVIAMSVVMTFCFHRTGGSVLPGILVHGWGNFITKGVGVYEVTKIDDRMWMFFAAAVIVILLTRGALGRKRYLEKLGDPALERPGPEPAGAA